MYSEGTINDVVMLSANQQKNTQVKVIMAISCHAEVMKTRLAVYVVACS